MHRALLLPVAFAMALGLTSCSPDESSDRDRGASSATLAEVGEDGIRTVRITPAGNDMRFEQTEIHASAGETLRVVFDNIATSPAMHHNVLFVTDRGSIDVVGRAAMGAGDNDFVPDHPAVIASTPMAAPGETVELTFTVPEEPGEYPFICTYPGHFVMMQGTLYVAAAPEA